MKILFGMPDENSWGGVRACEPPFVAAIRRLGVETREETYVWGEKLGKTTLRERVERVLRTARKFRQLTRQEQFNVVHLNTAFDMKTVLRDLTTVSFVRQPNTKIFLKLHGSEEQLLQTKDLIKRRLWQRLFARVDGIGVLSSEEQANFITAGIDENKVFTVKNAVRMPLDLPPRNFDGKILRLLFVSRFIPTKGLLDTVRAAAILNEKNVNFVLTCVGDGETRAAAKELVQELNLRERVQFTGYVSEEKVDEFYRTQDALVFPTFHAEGFPMVIFNAMAFGLPIITTRIRAAADYLSDSQNCLWTEAKNPAMLAEKIIELFENQELRRQMSANNVRLAQSFTAENIAPEYLEIYEQLRSRK